MKTEGNAVGYRSATNSDGQMVQSFPLGGKIGQFEVRADVWTEFDPVLCDWHWMEVPVTSGRVVHTNTATFPDLVDGAPVVPAAKGFATLFPGTFDFCTDRSATDPVVRFFFAIVDGDADETAEIVVMEAAS